MRNYFTLSHFSFLVFLFIFLPNPSAKSWGFYAHRKINQLAVFTLPDGMIGFYKKNINYLSQHATDADKRRYAVADEAPKHFIDLDYYRNNFKDTLPYQWKVAVNLFTEDTLMKHGIVPWHINKMLNRLTKAFLDKDIDLILHHSADLGHYIADAHVPLHTTENYNGQFTGQHGIHALWESRIPEAKANQFEYWTGAAYYIANPEEAVWNIINTSHLQVNTVLKSEKQLSEKYDSDKKYGFEIRGNQTIKTYSKEYINDYHLLLNGMVQQQMKASVLMTGSFWYTAWVNAGKPDLDALLNSSFVISDNHNNEKDSLLWLQETITEDHQ